MDLSQKVILVIGGTSGLGESAARMFLRCGAKVVVTGRSEDKISSAAEWLGNDGLAVQSDASDPLQVERTFEQVKEYIAEFSVPYNELHDKGFPSLGCAPCTRAVEPDEDIRAGRWWWESDPDAKECGLHVIAAATR